MTEQQQPAFASGIATPATGHSEPQRPTSARPRWLAIGLVALGSGACICVCALLGFAVFGTSAIRSLTERPRVERVLDQFMNAMEGRDTSQAYSLFSARARRSLPLAGIESMVEGNNYVLFDGYQQITVTGMQVQAAFNTNPDAPQGTLARVQATVDYEGGFTGNLEALLELEEGEWRLDHIDVVVPPDKLVPVP